MMRELDMRAALVQYLGDYVVVRFAALHLPSALSE